MATAPQMSVTAAIDKSSKILTSPSYFRSQGHYWKRRGHRGEEDDTEDDVTKDLDDSSTGASIEEGSISKNGTFQNEVVVFFLLLF